MATNICPLKSKTRLFILNGGMSMKEVVLHDRMSIKEVILHDNGLKYKQQMELLQLTIKTVWSKSFFVKIVAWIIMVAQQFKMWLQHYVFTAALVRICIDKQYDSIKIQVSIDATSISYAETFQWWTPRCKPRHKDACTVIAWFIWNSFSMRRALFLILHRCRHTMA